MASASDSKDDDQDSVSVGPRYLTRVGAERMHKELSQLLKVERPKVTAEVSAAAAQGDRSENAEYIYGKRKLREIDRRIRFLSKRLDTCSIVDPKEQKDSSKVYFGATLTVEDEEGSVFAYQIVGPDEVDAKGGKISVESPVGRAVIGKKLGQSIRVVRPKGEVELTILEIRYT